RTRQRICADDPQPDLGLFSDVAQRRCAQAGNVGRGCTETHHFHGGGRAHLPGPADTDGAACGRHGRNAVIAALTIAYSKSTESSLMRTCYTGEVSREHLDQTVTLFGWVHRRRDHGGVIFIDLRDRAGLAQIVVDPDNHETFATAERIRNEYCVRISGLVRLRPEGTSNADLASGEIEVLCREIEILNPSVTPPFQLD